MGLMSCLTALNCFKTTRPEFSRPNANINIGGKSVRALFDTGSGVTLCNNTIRPLGSLPCSLANLPMLKTANGNNLNITRCKIPPVFVPNSSTPIHQTILFVLDLQVPCLLEMDLMKKARITIVTYEGKIRVQPPAKEKQARKRLICRRTHYNLTHGRS